MTVGDRIRLQRESVGITQTDLANKVKISKQTLYKYENNVITNIPSNNLEEIAKYLCVSPAYLMGWETPNLGEAEMFADLIGDRKLMEYVIKISQLSDVEKENVYKYIDFVCTQK